jgi:hypothetical protein
LLDRAVADVIEERRDSRGAREAFGTTCSSCSVLRRHHHDARSGAPFGDSVFDESG